MKVNFVICMLIVGTVANVEVLASRLVHNVAPKSSSTIAYDVDFTHAIVSEYVKRARRALEMNDEFSGDGEDAEEDEEEKNSFDVVDAGFNTTVDSVLSTTIDHFGAEIIGFDATGDSVSTEVFVKCGEEVMENGFTIPAILIIAIILVTLIIVILTSYWIYRLIQRRRSDCPDSPKDLLGSDFSKDLQEL